MIFEFFSVVVRFNVFIIIIIRLSGKLCFILLLLVIRVLINIVVRISKFMVSEIKFDVVRVIIVINLFKVIYFCLFDNGWVMCCLDRIKKFLLRFCWVVKLGFVVSNR